LSAAKTGAVEESVKHPILSKLPTTGTSVGILAGKVEVEGEADVEDVGNDTEDDGAKVRLEDVPVVAGGTVTGDDDVGGDVDTGDAEVGRGVGVVAAVEAGDDGDATETEDVDVDVVAGEDESAHWPLPHVWPGLHALHKVPTAH
jgi:hypothetical protein